MNRELFRKVAADADLGRPGARKTGLDPRWPYVPIIEHPGTSSAQKPSVRQVEGVAFATRQEALDAARDHIDSLRSDLERKLADPAHRALRDHYGLARELPGDEPGRSGTAI